MNEDCRLRIAIDGPASCGKGTVACLLAERLGYIFVDTGAMYRAVALLTVQQRLDIRDEVSVGLLAEKSDIKFYYVASSRSYKTFVDGVDVSGDIRSPEIDVASSKVALLRSVRTALVYKQQEIAKGGGVVMEGRDITTVVMPNAEVKIYLTASVEERARRRYLQRSLRGIPSNMNDLIAELVERDKRDVEREVGPLRMVNDAFICDTTNLTPEQSVLLIENEIRKRFPCIPSEEK